ncbi:MAG: DNA (cytosine-5-)-methyltransferase [Alphaproteobacteria bacterium]|nr:DNA (cytosine-5-)-methyltransferase [Alphaproteobacteria bacterium]
MNNVAKIRKEKHITQIELAKIAGISRTYLSKIEKNTVTPSIVIAMKLSKMLNVSIDKLFMDIEHNHGKILPKKMSFVDLFCGIGGFRYASQKAFDQLNIKGKCVFSSDIDKYAQEAYEANFSERPAGDITKIKASQIPTFDLLFGGFPCQTFSICGLRKGFEDTTRGTLFFDIARIIKAKQPQAFVLENVKNLASHNNGKTIRTIIEVLRDELGYYVDYHLLNALDFGLPQKRERVLILGAKKPFKMDWNFKVEKQKTLSDILDKVVDKKYYASKDIISKRKAMHTSKYYPAIWHENKSGNISSYPYSCALRAGASYNYLLVNGERRLTPREMLRLQGFPETFKIVVSDCQTRKQAGNAIPVDMVAEVIKRFLPIAF